MAMLWLAFLVLLSVLLSAAPQWVQPGTYSIQACIFAKGVYKEEVTNMMSDIEQVKKLIDRGLAYMFVLRYRVVEVGQYIRVEVTPLEFNGRPLTPQEMERGRYYIFLSQQGDTVGMYTPGGGQQRPPSPIPRNELFLPDYVPYYGAPFGYFLIDTGNFYVYSAGGDYGRPTGLPEGRPLGYYGEAFYIDKRTLAVLGRETLSISTYSSPQGERRVVRGGRWSGTVCELLEASVYGGPPRPGLREAFREVAQFLRSKGYPVSMRAYTPKDVLQAIRRDPPYTPGDGGRRGIADGRPGNPPRDIGDPGDVVRQQPEGPRDDYTLPLIGLLAAAGFGMYVYVGRGQRRVPAAGAPRPRF